MLFFVTILQMKESITPPPKKNDVVLQIHVCGGVCITILTGYAYMFWTLVLLKWHEDQYSNFFEFTNIVETSLRSKWEQLDTKEGVQKG